jgi:hypothetical protein
VCTAKLRCDICGSNKHMTGKCPILKHPRLLAHPCGYDVSGLGFLSYAACADLFKEK